MVSTKKNYRTKKMVARETPFPEEGYVTDEQVAVFLGICAKTVWDWVKHGKLPSPRRLAARATRWDAQSIRAFANNGIA